MRNLLAVARSYVEEFAPEAWPYVRDETLPGRSYAEQPSRNLPATDLAAGIAELANDRTKALFNAVLAAAPHAHWRQGYSEADGFGEGFFDNYGWFHLVSPRGLFPTNRIRLDFAYWGRGIPIRSTATSRKRSTSSSPANPRSV